MATNTVKDLLEDWAFNALSNDGHEFNQARANEVEVREEVEHFKSRCECCDSENPLLNIYLNGKMEYSYYGELEDYFDEILPPNLLPSTGMNRDEALAELGRLVARDDEGIESDCE